MGLVTGNIPALEAIQQDTAIGLAGWQFQPTDFGRALLDGKADWVKENGIDRWLGGAHLHGHDVWRWNGEHLIQGAD
ncbi:MAG TPA: hypothetical protein VHV83_15600 [Armatimonadota bacterium]|nr:hypothetical protein [Armatimonadota bacterium]